MKRIPYIGAGLVIIALLAVNAVPNLIKARNRSRQKRTMADMRSIATAWETRATDVKSYAVGAAHSRVTAAELAHALEPTYIRKLPTADAWGTEFQLATAAPEGYVIRSLGSDGRPDRVANLSGPTTKFSDDIVFSNGSFIRYPESSG